MPRALRVINPLWSSCPLSSHKRNTPSSRVLVPHHHTNEPQYLHHSFKVPKASTCQPRLLHCLSIKASGPSLGSSASSTGSSTSSARWWHQDPNLWVQRPCQLGTRCFKAPTHSVRGPRHCKVGLGGINDISWGHYKSMLESMKISSKCPSLSLMTTTHAPPMSMLPFCLHLSPFGINGKGSPHIYI